MRCRRQSLAGHIARASYRKHPQFPPHYCSNPLTGYCYAIVRRAFGPVVPDTLDTRLFGVVKIEDFNLDFE